MPSQIFTPGGITTSEYAFNTLDRPWTNYSNALVEDGSYAEVTGLDNLVTQSTPNVYFGEFTYFLDYNTFGMEEGVTLPSNIVVTGLIFRVKAAVPSNTSVNNIVVALFNGFFQPDGGPTANRVPITGTSLAWYEAHFLPQPHFTNDNLPIITLRTSYGYIVSGTGTGTIRVDAAQVELEYELGDSEFWTEFKGTTEIVGG